MWVRPWILQRQLFGIYDQLLVELRNKDPCGFKMFLRMTPGMFDELLYQLIPSLTNHTTNLREPLEPGLKIGIALRHLASGSKYADMQFGWRVPSNTITGVVKEVCQAIIVEYLDKLMSCPSTPDEWQQVANKFKQK